MEKLFYTVKSQAAHFRLDFCCWFAPVRVGLLITGYFNIIADVICLISIANDGWSPTIISVQEILIEDFVNKPIPVLAYVTELGFSVILLCAIYRKDLVLMRVFMYYTIVAVIMSFLIYSIVIVGVPGQIQVAIVSSTLFQMYVILLVRSMIVEMKMEQKKYELPTLVMSSLVQEKDTPGSADSKNGQPQIITITEAPKKQEVQVTVIRSQDDDIKEETKDEEVKIDTGVKKDTEVKNNTEAKNDAEVKIVIEPKKDEKKNKDEKKSKDDKKSKEAKNTKDAEKVKGSKDSKKEVKETWLQTVTEHPKE